MRERSGKGQEGSRKGRNVLERFNTSFDQIMRRSLAACGKKVAVLPERLEVGRKACVLRNGLVEENW